MPHRSMATIVRNIQDVCDKVTQGKMASIGGFLVLLFVPFGYECVEID